MIFSKKEWEKLEQFAIKYRNNGFHPNDWVIVEYERGIAVGLSRPLPEDAEINTVEYVYFKLGDFLPS
jgi:hypothetical protein